MAKPIISADSHVTEPPDTYVARIDRRFKDRAPHVVRDPQRGDLFVIEGIDKPIPIGLVAAAGKPAETLTKFGARFEDLHRGGWDPEARLADQDRDGVAAEVSSGRFVNPARFWTALNPDFFKGTVVERAVAGQRVPGAPSCPTD
jgi:hypothetical protein